MKKYYELIGQRIVACLDWNEGYGSIEEAKNYFVSEIREINKEEYNRLSIEYTSTTVKQRLATKEQLDEIVRLCENLRLPVQSPPKTYERAERIIQEIKANWGE